MEKKKGLLVMACASMVALSGISCATVEPQPAEAATTASSKLTLKVQGLMSHQLFGEARKAVKDELNSYGKEQVPKEIWAQAKKLNEQIDEQEIAYVKSILDNELIRHGFGGEIGEVVIDGVPSICEETDINCNFLRDAQPVTQIISYEEVAKKYDAIRNSIWKTLPSSDSVHVINEVYKYRCDLVAKKVNPYHYRDILAYLPGGVKQYLANNDFEGARNYVSSYVDYAVYGDILDIDLENVHKALLAIPTDAKKSATIFEEARVLMAEIFGSEEFQLGGTDSQQGEGFEPDDSQFNAKMDVFKDHLLAYGCSEADRQKILDAFEADARAIIDKLREEGPYSENTYLPTTIATGKLNVLQAELKKFMIDEVIKTAEDAYLKEQAEIKAQQVLNESATDAQSMLSCINSMDSRSLSLLNSNEDGSPIDNEIYADDVEIYITKEVDAEDEDAVKQTLEEEKKAEENAIADGKRLVKIKKMTIYSKVLLAMKASIIEDMDAQTKALVEAGKYDDAREYLWTQYLDIPEEIKASINVHRVQLMNAYVNPANYASILNEMRDGIKGLVEAGKFDEARAFLAGIAPVGGFTKNLNESLYNVKNTIVAMDIAEDGAQVLVNDAGAMLYDYLASKVYEDKFLAAGELFKPNDAAFQGSLDDFLAKAALYGCTQEQQVALKEAIMNDAMPLIRAKYVPFAECNDEIPAVLGVAAMNELVNAQKKILSEEIIDSAQAAIRIKALSDAIVPLVESEKYEEARNAIFEFGVLGIKNVDRSVFAVKCGLLNTLVNPRKMTAIYADLETTVTAALEKKDYQAAIAAVEALEFVPYYLPSVDKEFDQAADIAVNNHRVNAEIAAQVMDKAREIVASWFIPRDGKEDAGYALGHIESWEDVEKHLSNAGSILIGQDCNKDDIDALNAQIIQGLKNGVDNTGFYEYLNTKQYNDEIEALKAQYKAIIAGAIANDEDAEIENAKSTFVSEVELSSFVKALIAASRSASDKGISNVLVDAVRVLRRYQRDIAPTQDDAATLLVAGTYMGYEDLINLAISTGVDINAPSVRDCKARSAYLVGLQYGFLGRIEKLLAKASHDVVDAEGYGAIRYAIAAGNIETLKALLIENVSARKVGKDGRTDLIFAVDMESITMVRDLLVVSDISAFDANGRTALLAAVMADRLDIVKVLVDAGASLAVKTADGMDALDLAFKAKNVNMINYLLSKKMTPSINLIIDLIASGDLAMFQLIVDKIEITDAMLAIAVDKGQLPMMTYLVNLGANLNAPEVVFSIENLDKLYAADNAKLAELLAAKSGMAAADINALKAAYAALNGVNTAERQQVLSAAIGALSNAANLDSYLKTIDAVKAVLTNAKSNADCLVALESAKTILTTIGESDIALQDMDMIKAILGISVAGDNCNVTNAAAHTICGFSVESKEKCCKCKEALATAEAILSSNTSSTAECLNALEAVKVILVKANDENKASIEAVRVVTAFSATEWINEAIPELEAAINNIKAIQGYLESEGVR